MSDEDSVETNPFAISPPAAAADGVNPYAPTSSVSAADFELADFGVADVESFRRAYLTHESSIRAIGTLCLIPGVLMLCGFALMLLGLIASFFMDVEGAIPDEGFFEFLIATLLYGLIGLVQVYAGLGLRKFKLAPKIIVTIFSLLGLLFVPFVTIISAYFLYLLHGAKGRVVFSDAYQEAIRRTPHIRSKVSTILTILFVLSVVAILLGMIALAVST